jgi:hypothetical protein
MPLSLGLLRPKGICFVLVAAIFVVLWIVQDSRFVRNATSSSSQWQGVVISKDEWWVTNNPNKKNNDPTSRSVGQGPQHLNTIERLQTLAGSFPAAQFVYDRYRAYQDVGDAARWKYRGVGYLYWTHGLILAASYDPTTKVIAIRNIAQSSATAAVDCHLFTLWVRMAGPEIFAGAPTAVNDNDGSSSSSCHWQFPIPHLHVTGQYQIDVKLLMYNGRAPIRLHKSKFVNLPPTQCQNVQMGNDTSTSSTSSSGQRLPPYHEGIRAFKLYDPVQSCCEICSRLSHCIYWATPPVNFDASYTSNGCEFWFDEYAHMIPPSKHLGRNGTPITLIRRRERRHHHHRRRLDGVIMAHGRPHDYTVAYFMGCGWSYWFTLDYPCLSGDLDDRVYVVEPTVVHPTNPTTTINDKNDPTTATTPLLPLCTTADERAAAGNNVASASGRWVRGMSTAAAACPPYQRDAAFATRFDIVEFTTDQPHCWHRDNLANIGNACLEMNCRFIPPTSIWRSPIHLETDWYGYWRPYKCDYLEFTKDQLQSCVTHHRIASIDVFGKSIADFLNQYLLQRLNGIVMYQPAVEGSGGGATEPGVRVVLTTLGALHWAGGSDDDLATAANGEMRQLLQQFKGNNNNPPKVYLVPGFFLSSERATQTHVDRMQLINERVMAPLVSDETNVTLLEAFEMSAAFTYDTATQNDGMHIIGPTMKMIITKLFHHLCADTTEGSRVGGSASHQ